MIISMIVLLLNLTKILANYTIFALILRISKNLHNKMIQCLTRTPVTFFDANPQGRVLNRFSKDISVVDIQISYMYMIFLQVLGQVIVASILSVLVIPFMAAVLVFMIVILFLLKKKIAPVTSEALKWDAITRSPINSLFSSSIRGLFTIRAFNK